MTLTWLHNYLNGLSPAELHFQILILLAALVYVGLRVYRTYQKLRFVADTPTSRIASAAQGYVELQGWGEYLPDSVIVSPFSQKRCLWYQCRVEVRRRSGKRSYWVEESNDTSDELFLIRDDSGDCVVNPEGAEVIPAISNVWYGHDVHQRHQVTNRSGWFGTLIGSGNYRFTEKLVQVADPLHVVGHFESIRKTVDPATVEDQVKELIRTWKLQPHRFLKRFDLDDNNKIQSNEWKLVAAEARRQVLERHQTPLIHTIRKPGEGRFPYLISCYSEAELLAKKRVLVITFLMIFFVLLSIFLIFLDFSLTSS